MKVKNIILGLLGFSLLALSSCEKTFDQLEKDSNRAVQVPASLVLQSVELNVMNDNGRLVIIDIGKSLVRNKQMVPDIE